MSYRVGSLRSWMIQRISAVYLALYLLAVGAWFVVHPLSGYDAWRDWFARAPVAVASTGFLLAVLLHGWVGLRDVILDYMHPLGLRLLLLTLVACLLIACGFWGLRILLLAGTPA